MTFRPNHNLQRDLERSPQFRAAMAAKGRQVADTAERVGQQVADSYRCDVENTADGIQVVANSGGINAAGWIEYGTSKLPAAAPLRKGAEAAGLNFRVRTRGGN